LNAGQTQTLDAACIFCNIVGNRIPCHRVYEDDAVLAFLDIGPLTRGHVLVIPKSHHATLMDLPAEVAGQIAERLPKLSRAVLKATGASGVHLLVNNGKAAQQAVGHVHFHLIPRSPGDGFKIPWEAGTVADAEGLRAAIHAAIE
jgi:histidine triad (HIT) family protein